MSDNLWYGKPYQPRLKCLLCNAPGGLTWQNVVNLDRQQTTIYMACVCGFRHELERPTDPEDFDERLERPGRAAVGLTFEQHKSLRDLSAFIDKDQED